MPNQQESFENTQAKFVNTSNEYVVKYNKLFEEKNLKFKELDKTVSDALVAHQKNRDEFDAKAKANMENLEKTYADKLRLSKPAEYWNKMNTEYAKKGKLYMIISGIIAFLIATGLTVLLIKIPNIVNAEHWFDLARNTAMLTVITTVLVYILRITVKLALSSFHLAADAKEREQLTYFYLSLMKEKAVTDKERELVLTSLFSRSDSGLLKGDATPEMPKIADFINKS